MNYTDINDAYHKEILDLASKFDAPKYYINRELSFLDFNKRVLHQALRKEIPLLEKLKYLGITASNLDEFTMVRFSYLLNKLDLNSDQEELSGLTAMEEYEQTLDEILKFKHLQLQTYEKLVSKLNKNNIHICKFSELSSKEKGYVEKLFSRNIYPLITPITYDTSKELPSLKSRQLNIVVSLKDNHNRNLEVISLITLDKSLDRIYKIESDDIEEDKYILLEEIVFNFLHRIFINKTILYKGCMRILKEANIDLDNDTDIYITDRMKQNLLQRELSQPIFMDVTEDIPKHILKLLVNIFDLNKRHIFKSNMILNLSFLSNSPIKNASLEYVPFSPQFPQELIGEHDMFTAIDTNDIILHHPYESYSPVVNFIEHASVDPNVLAIKQTLYRVSSPDSPIVEALCRAAENGKQVSVLLEIKARFDEDRNISLIEKLKLSGCKLIYGVEEFKTHCKFIIVVRKSNKGLRLYSHLGTGNYNDTTAKIYTDLSYFTSKEKIGEDLLTVFNILSGFSEPTIEVNKLFFSPYNLRSKLYELIDREIAIAKEGNKASITFKLNSLSDKGMIKKLYKASEAGVKINLICRGICSMKAINKNISIRSIVGRFLEHSRIYYFYNSNKPLLFISSADLLTRNLNKRFELLIPLTDAEVRSKLLNILDSYFKDNFNTYLMDDKGCYKLLKDTNVFNIHEYFMNRAIENYKLKNIPKMSFKKKKK